MSDGEPFRNHLGQPVGFPVPGWTPRPAPPRTPMVGRFCTVEPLDGGRHAAPRLFHAIVDRASGKAVGVGAYANIQASYGTIEVGALNFSPRLQRRPAATEEINLMMRRVFDELGYRR